MEGHCRKGKSKDECCGECSGHHGHDAPKEIDVKALGPEAVELAGMFKEVNDGLVSALEARHRILTMLHEKAKDPKIKEKFDKVIESRHPVLIQFVFGQQ
jgi:hypothetical protein